MTPVIQTEELTKFYGPVRGVEGLDLEVMPGEVFGFLGPNGAGKTTTIRLLLDLIRPTSGTARVFGLDPRADGMAVRRRVGYLSGDLQLYERLTARQITRYLGSVRGDHDEARTEAMAARLGLDLDRPVGKLSRGNRQKAGLVQAFVHEPDLLLLDEPTAGLDPLVQQEFEDMVGEAIARGATVFLSSHILSEVQDLADRAGVIRDGRLVAVENVADLRLNAIQEIEVRFAGPADIAEFRDIPGVREAEMTDGTLRCRIEGRADPLVKALARHDVESISGHELDLEDVFLAYYGSEST